MKSLRKICLIALPDQHIFSEESRRLRYEVEGIRMKAQNQAKLEMVFLKLTA